MLRAFALWLEPVAGRVVPDPVIGGLEQTAAPPLGIPADTEGTIMPNTPGPAAEKRTPPLDRKNAQDDHEGSPHRPEEFAQANPAVQVDKAQTKKEE